MATPTPRGSKRPLPATPAKQDVDPGWLLRVLGLSLGVAALLGYLCVCLLVYQGGWQRFLTPSRVVGRTPAALGIPFEAVRFDIAETGQPRLTAWSIPGNEGGLTVLFLHDGQGSLADALPHLELLHRAGFNLFALDYRGFGESEPIHPGERTMDEDARHALAYVLEHNQGRPVLVYGLGLGAVAAAHLAAGNGKVALLAIEDPDPNAFARIVSDPAAGLLPMRLLLRDHFNLRAALAPVRQPKLLIADTPFGFEAARLKENQLFFAQLPDPKMTVSFANPHSDDAYLATLRRFTEEYPPPVQ